MNGGPQARLSSPSPGRSTLITFAPKSPSSIVASGPDSTLEKSAITRSCSGGVRSTTGASTGLVNPLDMCSYIIRLVRGPTVYGIKPAWRGVNIWQRNRASRSSPRSSDSGPRTWTNWPLCGSRCVPTIGRSRPIFRRTNPTESWARRAREYLELLEAWRDDPRLALPRINYWLTLPCDLRPLRQCSPGPSARPRSRRSS